MPRRQTGMRGKRAGFGRVTPSKVAWLVTKTTRQISLHEFDTQQVSEELEFTLPAETGNALVLMMPVPGRVRPLVWDLTGMTSEELDATRQFFEYIFDLADPIVRERDKVAADAFTEGDDSFDRLHRSLPQFVVRERPQQVDSKSLHVGPEDVTKGNGDERDLHGGVPVCRDELADGEQREGSSQDDG